MTERWLIAKSILVACTLSAAFISRLFHYRRKWKLGNRISAKKG